ncbi:MAG: C4-type zinc ribbon domain-containing protein [Desulfobacteraceae bacterium]|nr:C4-type zinc ribbon domain-containing protein [Desulfobacteraceae bacterium]
MKNRLELLEQLQEIDVQVDVMKTAQHNLQSDMDGIARAMDDAREVLASLQARAAQLEKDKAELEVSHKTELENIQRSETNMKEIKTNKEYQAVGREIAAARKQVAELEDQVLQKITQLDELNNEIAASRAALEELEQNTELRRSAKQEEIDKVQQDIDVDSLRREVITKELPANVIKRYDNLRAQRRGQAIAVARDGYCLGCNMHLPPQLYNSLFKCEELITCPHCQRMLILKHQPAQ